MNAFDVLGDPVRRRILELLADGERTSGDLADRICQEFGISQAAVSQHLRVLRESGFANSMVDGRRRIYLIRPEPFSQIDEWLQRFSTFWEDKLDALETEVARAKFAKKDLEGES